MDNLSNAWFPNCIHGAPVQDTQGSRWPIFGPWKQATGVFLLPNREVVGCRKLAGSRIAAGDLDLVAKAVGDSSSSGSAVFQAAPT